MELEEIVHFSEQDPCMCGARRDVYSVSKILACMVLDMHSSLHAIKFIPTPLHVQSHQSHSLFHPVVFSLCLLGYVLDCFPSASEAWRSVEEQLQLVSELNLSPDVIINLKVMGGKHLVLSCSWCHGVLELYSSYTSCSALQKMDSL